MGNCFASQAHNKPGVTHKIEVDGSSADWSVLVCDLDHPLTIIIPLPQPPPPPPPQFIPQALKPRR